MYEAMMKFVKFIFICFLVLTSGCAVAPSSIAPMQINENKYSNYECDKLTAEQDKLTTQLTMYSMAQEQTRTSDTIGVIMLLLPLGSISGGNKAPEISMLKGEINALQKIGRIKDCNLQFPQIAEYKAPPTNTSEDSM